jgi:hypothetical protein
MGESSETPKRGITRGTLLKGAGATALGVGIVAVGYESLKHTETKIDFSTHGADYRLLSGTHGSDDMGPWDVVNPLRKSDVPDDTTVFEIETGTFPYLDKKIFPNLGKLYAIAGDIDFFNEPAQLLTDKRLPMVLVDSPAPKFNPSSIIDLGIVTSAAGLAVLQRREKKPSRRNFMLAGAGALLAPVIARDYSEEILKYLQRSLSEPWAQRAAKLNRWVELAKPDDLFHTFRNSLIAAKNLGLEPQLATNPQTGRPKMLMMYGSGHIALPEYMKGGKQTILNYLSLYPKVFIDKTFGLDNPHLYTSAILTPDEHGEVRVQTVEDTDLKAVFT